MPESVGKRIAEHNERRHNHYDPENVNHCRQCGSYVSPTKVAPGVLRYDCRNCGETVYESKPMSLRTLEAASD